MPTAPAPRSRDPFLRSFLKLTLHVSPLSGLDLAGHPEALVGSRAHELVATCEPQQDADRRHHPEVDEAEDERRRDPRNGRREPHPEPVDRSKPRRDPQGGHNQCAAKPRESQRGERVPAPGGQARERQERRAHREPEAPALAGSQSRSKYSLARSRSTLGAKGRKPSRNLIFRFICACIRGLRGSPRILRAPSARGPNSILPSNQPTTFSWARSSATRRSRQSRSTRS